MEKMFEITKGHDPGACFWIQPVRVHSKECFGWDAVEECPEEEISLNEEDVFSFLQYFFRKYFNEYLIYNREREDNSIDSTAGDTLAACFEWYLTHNFYDYHTAERMAADMESYADNLEQSGLECVPEEYLKYYLVALN